MAEHEFGETMEMIFYVILFALVVFYAGFLYVVNTKITYHYDYSIGEILGYALWVIRASNITLMDLNNHSIHYIIDSNKIMECKNKDLSCVGISLPPNTEIIFILPDKEEGYLIYKRFLGKKDKNEEKIILREIIPVIYYYQGKYLSGRVEVISYDKK